MGIRVSVDAVIEAISWMIERGYARNKDYVIADVKSYTMGGDWLGRPYGEVNGFKRNEDGSVIVHFYGQTPVTFAKGCPEQFTLEGIRNGRWEVILFAEDERKKAIESLAKLQTFLIKK